MPQPKPEGTPTDPTDPTAPTDPPPPAPAEWVPPADRKATAAKAQRDAETNTAWTSAKTAITANIPSAELDGAAAATKDGKKVNTGETITGGDYTYSVTEARLGSPARALLIAQGIDPDAKVKIGGEEFTKEQVLEARLKEIAEEKGFGKKAATPTVTNENDQAKLKELGL
jgi:hypothetical protein